MSGDITPRKMINLRQSNFLLNNMSMSGMSNEAQEKSFLTSHSNKKTLANIYFTDFKKQFSNDNFTSRNIDQKQVSSIKDIKNMSHHYSNQRNSIDISQMNKNPTSLISQLQNSHNYLSTFYKQSNANDSNRFSNFSGMHNSINENSEYFRRMNADVTQRSRESSRLKDCESLQKLIGDGDNDVIIFEESSKKIQF